MARRRKATFEPTWSPAPGFLYRASTNPMGQIPIVLEASDPRPGHEGEPALFSKLARIAVRRDDVRTFMVEDWEAKCGAYVARLAGLLGKETGT